MKRAQISYILIFSKKIVFAELVQFRASDCDPHLRTWQTLTLWGLAGRRSSSGRRGLGLLAERAHGHLSEEYFQSGATEHWREWKMYFLP